MRARCGRIINPLFEAKDYLQGQGLDAQGQGLQALMPGQDQGLTSLKQTHGGEKGTSSKNGGDKKTPAQLFKTALTDINSRCHARRFASLGTCHIRLARRTVKFSSQAYIDV